MISMASFNNKGGVGKTTLTYHLAHMLERLGRNVLAADLDPRSNLTAAFLDDEKLEMIWPEPDGLTWPTGRDDVDNVTTGATTVAAAVRPIMEGMGTFVHVNRYRLWTDSGCLPVTWR